MTITSTNTMPTSKILLMPIIQTIWKYIGYNLYKNTITMNLTTLIAIVLVVCIPCMGIMVIILDEVTVPNLANTFESTGPFTQLLVKVVLTRLSLNIIRQLLHEMETKFWPIEYFGPEIQERQMQTYRLIKYCLKVYIYTIYPCIVIMSIRPVFYDDRRYPLMVYNIVNISNTPFYIACYSIQVFGLFYATGNFLSVDGLFALFVVNVLCQIIMLKHAFASLRIDIIKDVDEKEWYAKLKEYVDHHNLILVFIQKLSDLYSVQTFFQFVGNTASICMGVYITSMSGMEDISTSIRAISIVLCWFFQMAVYCVGGTLLTEACAEIANSMYDSGWEGPYRRKFRYATEMIIMQSQTPKVMKAGKIFDVNLASFSGVLRLSLSIYTLMNSVTNQNGSNRATN